MSESAGKAVFLSYASQDADAALRLCSALRAAGIEVWFDAEGGLENGDEWDAQIRRQIKECIASELGAGRRGDRDVSVMNNAGRYAEARAEGETLVRESPDNRLFRGFVGSCAARLGDTEGARAALTWLGALDGKYRFGHHLFLQAQIAAVLGQRDDALQFLREAKAQFAAPVDGFSPLTDILINPDFESLADDPEFKALLTPKG